MRVAIMQLNETSDMENNTTLMQVDNETLITVKGFGCGCYAWKVSNCAGGSNPDYDPMGILPWQLTDYEDPENKGFLIGSTTIGAGAVWAEELTFAHLVVDILNNQ